MQNKNEKDNLLKALREIEAKCRELSDASRIIEAAKDKNSSLQFFAISVPKLKSLLRNDFSFSRQSDNDLLKIWSFAIFTSPYYEVKALGLYNYNQPRNCAVDGLNCEAISWLSVVENWGHCDLLAGVIARLAKSNWSEMRPHFEEWSESENLWANRLSIVGLVQYVGKNSIYLDFEVAKPFICKHLRSKNVYISRAVGWVLREYLRNDVTGSPKTFLDEVWCDLPAPARQKLALYNEAKE